MGPKLLVLCTRVTPIARKSSNIAADKHTVAASKPKFAKEIWREVANSTAVFRALLSDPIQSPVVHDARKIFLNHMQFGSTAFW
jgi:hypothetical protein